MHFILGKFHEVLSVSHTIIPIYPPPPIMYMMRQGSINTPKKGQHGTLVRALDPWLWGCGFYTHWWTIGMSLWPWATRVQPHSQPRMGKWGIFPHSFFFIFPIFPQFSSFSPSIWASGWVNYPPGKALAMLMLSKTLSYSSPPRWKIGTGKVKQTGLCWRSSESPQQKIACWVWLKCEGGKKKEIGTLALTYLYLRFMNFAHDRFK